MDNVISAVFDPRVEYFDPFKVPFSNRNSSLFDGYLEGEIVGSGYSADTFGACSACSACSACCCACTACGTGH